MKATSQASLMTPNKRYSLILSKESRGLRLLLDAGAGVVLASPLSNFSRWVISVSWDVSKDLSTGRIAGRQILSTWRKFGQRVLSRCSRPGCGGIITSGLPSQDGLPVCPRNISASRCRNWLAVPTTLDANHTRLNRWSIGSGARALLGSPKLLNPGSIFVPLSFRPFVIKEPSGSFWELTS